MPSVPKRNPDVDCVASTTLRVHAVRRVGTGATETAWGTGNVPDDISGEVNEPGGSGSVAGVADARTEGAGTGKSLTQFPIRAGDHVLAGRGYSTARGIGHVVDAGGRLIVRVNTGSLPLYTAAGRPFDLLAAVSSVTRAGAVRSWATTVAVPGDDNGPAGEVAGRVCVLRESAEAIRLAHEKIRRDAARKGNQVQPATLRFAEYVIVFTTFPTRPSRPRTCWSGIASASRSNWCSSASSRRPSWDTC